MSAITLRACCVCLLVAACCASGPRAHAAEPAAGLLIAFTSFRERTLHPEVYFYEHDGKANGKIVGKITPVNKRSDHHPALASDGTSCMFAAEVEGQISVIQYWDLAGAALLELPLLNKTPNTQMAPTFAADRNLLCFEAWNRPGSAGRWDLLLYDVRTRQLRETPNLNTTGLDERKPAISGDGRWIAYTTNAAADSLTDIRLYDRQTEQTSTPAQWNSPYSDTEPALTADGRLLAFVSDRPQGDTRLAGTRNIHLYDRAARQLLPLPGLNSPAQEQSPSITPDGRFVAFVSERLDGVGERDIYLYDRQAQRLIPTPGLNSSRDEYDPCVVLLP